MANTSQMENEEKKEMALHALQDAYSESMKTVGSAHRAAVEKVWCCGINVKSQLVNEVA